MSSESEDRCLLTQAISDDNTHEFHKEPKISYTRDFLLSLAEFDACKRLPCGFEASNLRELVDGLWIGLSKSRHDLDSRKFHANLSQHRWKNFKHGLLGSVASSRVSGSVAVASAPEVRGQSYHLLKRSAQPYRPPHFYKEKPHLRRGSNDRNNDETFGSPENLSREKADEERRRKDLFELMRKEQQKSSQEKQKEISDEHKGNLDPGIDTLVEDSGNDKRLKNKCNESEEFAVPPASNNDSARDYFPTQASASKQIPSSSTSRSLEKNLGTIPLTHPPVSEPLNVKADHTNSPTLQTSGFALQFLGEKKSAGGFSSDNKKSGPKVCRVLNEKFVEHNSADFPSGRHQITHKLMESTFTSATDEISEQLCSGIKPTVASGVLTCDEIDQSIPSVINERLSTQDHYVKGWSTDDMENRQPNSASSHSESQYLLSLLKKKVGLADLEASLKLNMEPSDKLHLSEIGISSNMPNISSKGNIENFKKNSTCEPMFGPGFTKVSQSTELSANQNSVGRVARNDVLAPCWFPIPGGDNDVIPSTVDVHNSIATNSEGIISTSCPKHTGLSKIEGSPSISSYFQYEQEPMPIPVSGFYENTDSNDEICLPEEDSLITFDDFIVSRDTMNVALGDSVKADLFALSSPVDIYEKFATFDVSPGDARSAQLGLKGSTSFYSFSDATGLETTYHNLYAQQSYPQFYHSQMSPGRAFPHSSESQETQMSSEIKFADSKTYPYSLQPVHSLMNVLSDPFQYPHAELARFDHPVNHSLLQQMPIPGPPPHQNYGLPRVAPPHHHINDLVSYAQQQSLAQNSSLNFQQQCYGGFEPIPDHITGGNSNQAAFNRLFEMEVRAQQMHPRAVAGHGQDVFGKQVEMGFWYGP